MLQQVRKVFLLLLLTIVFKLFELNNGSFRSFIKGSGHFYSVEYLVCIFIYV